jgi:hypothetical protein
MRLKIKKNIFLRGFLEEKNYKKKYIELFFIIPN